MRNKQSFSTNKSDFKLLDRNKLLIKPHKIIIHVKKKEKVTELGTTPYAFSYSFKGDLINYPIQPTRLIHVAKDMAKFIDKKEGLVLIALDRGGTALGLAVSMMTKLPLYIAFSYFTKPPNNWIWWEEKGYGKSLAIPPLPKNTRVILVDDEINTGLTFVNAIKILQEHSVYVDQILVVAEVVRKQMGRKIIKNKFRDIKIDSLYQIPEPEFHDKLDDYVFDI